MLKIDIDDREVRQALEDLRRRASDMCPAMHAIGQALMGGSRLRYEADADSATVGANAVLQFGTTGRSATCRW